MCANFCLWCLYVVFISSMTAVVAAQDSQTVMTSPDAQHWRVSVSDDWDVLGPFPIHAREQHFISPSFPISLSEPIDYEARWPSSYADQGEVGWSKATSANGVLEVSFPHIRWSSLRASEGWAALQHHTLLRTTITIWSPPDISTASHSPQLLVDIKQGSFFTILPKSGDDSTSRDEFVSRWYAGNIYAMAASPPHTVPLPTLPSPGALVSYDLFISGDYEIRLFGDPLTVGSEVPKLSIGFSIGIETAGDVVIRMPDHDVIPNFVDGWAFGDAIGVGLRSSGGWWTVTEVKVSDPAIEKEVDVQLLHETRIAPSQTRTVPILLSQTKGFTGLGLPLTISVISERGTIVFFINLPLKHIARWDATSFIPVISTYFFSGSIPAAFVAVPPKERNPNKAVPPLLFLHGAGVNVLDLSFWECAPPRQSQSWLILPTGRTEWGLDWHGPSTTDAWQSVTALSLILHFNPEWDPWGFPQDTRVVLLGHSNGGQGTWHVAARFPDKVIAAVPAAAYSKSQSYVPLLQSRSAHFVDPFLRAILESSLTPDDNDLFLSNLVDTPVLAIHGGADENVPVWHSRALVDTLKTWNADTNVTFREDPGQPHCYSAVFDNENTQAFVDQSLQSAIETRSKSFTLTVAVPSESGSLHGYKILALEIPGRLARLTVNEGEKGVVHISPKNVQALSIQPGSDLLVPMFSIEGQELAVQPALVRTHRYIILSEDHGTWKLAYANSIQIQPSGRVSAILSSMGPLQIVIPHKSGHCLSGAIRLAHSLDIYHKIDSNILDAQEAQALLQAGTAGNSSIVVISDGSNVFLNDVLAARRTPFGFSEDALTVNGRPVEGGSSAVFLHPHPTFSAGVMLVMYANTEPGLERALRLFPLRTGLTIPDWIITSEHADKTGAGGVQGAGVYGNDWSWNGAMSSF